MKIMKNKKKIALILAVVSVLTLAFGSLAYFTDRINFSTIFSTASNPINLTPKEDGTQSDDPGEDLENHWKDQNLALIAEGLVRPGDSYDLGYKLTNLGEAVDIRETILITVTDVKDDALNMNQSNPEWRVFGAFETDAHGAKTGTTQIANETISGNTIKYMPAPTTIDKNGTKTFSYYTILSKYASNNFQASKCKVEYLVEVRQHADGVEADEGWQALCTSEITFGGNNKYLAVPKA